MIESQDVKLPWVGKDFRDPMCGRTPAEMEAEYGELVEAENEDLEEGVEPVTLESYIWFNEGTLNTENGHFLCDRCYIRAGMPSSPGGWKCP